MIEIVKGKYARYFLSVDGDVVESGAISFFPMDESVREPDEPFSISIYDYELSRKLIEEYPLSAFPKETKKIAFRLLYLLFPDDRIRFDVSIEFGDKEYIIGLTSDIEYSEWSHPWSIKEYVSEFKGLIETANLPGIRFDRGEDRHDSMYFQIVGTNAETTINAEVIKNGEALAQIHEQAELALRSKLRADSVVTSFDFPEEVRVPCEQYLMYFGQFLKDLGVEAKTDIQHEAGQVLFSVTPNDKDEALDKIQAALKTYLQLASSPIGGPSDPENEMAIQGLLANVDHLKSQLRLSYMMVRTQEATIQAQQVTINNQQRILSGEVLLDSLKADTTRKPEDKEEEVIDGILSLGKYEDKGVTVNIGEVYRRLKRLFKKEE